MAYRQSDGGVKGYDDASRRRLLEKAIYSLPTKSLKNLLPNDSGEANVSPTLDYKIGVEEVAAGGERRPDPGRIVSIRVHFPDLIVQKDRERPFLKELTDQLRVALSGSAGEPLASTLLPRASDSDFANVQLSLPLLRAEQLRSLLETPNLLAYTPLLRFARFDHEFFNNVTGPTSTGIREQTYFPAPAIVTRLDEMEKRYLEIRERRNLIESFHHVMKQTNPYEQRAAQMSQLELDRIAKSGPVIPGFDAVGAPQVEPKFPWTTEGPPPQTSSPRGYQEIIVGESGQSVCRPLPPSATVVLAKNALETAVQQLSVDGVQLSAASAEITRRLEEAEENAELSRIASAGLASPQVLEQLIKQSTLRREQQRQKDELRVLAAWEKDELANATRENNLAYMQKLFAVATGDDDALAELDQRLVLNPEKLRVARGEILSAAKREFFEKKNNSKRQNFAPNSGTVGISFFVVASSNVPAGAETFVRIKVSSGGEAQTASSPSPSWNEGLFLEISKSAMFSPETAIELQLFQYNSLGRDVLLASALVATSALHDTNDQAGVWILAPAAECMQGLNASLSMRIGISADETRAYSRVGGKGLPSSAFAHDLQASQNLMRERNMDFVLDQVERIEEERRRVERRVGEVEAGISASAATSLGPLDDIPDEGVKRAPERMVDLQKDSAVDGRNSKILKIPVSNNSPTPPLRQVAKPFPTYDALYREILTFVERGRLADARQLCFDLVYVGQSKVDFHRDPKMPDYLSLLSDVLVEFQSDTPIVVAGLNTLCVMYGSLELGDARRRQVAMVIWEAAVRSIREAATDKLLSEQVLTGLSLVVHEISASKSAVEVTDFLLAMSESAREPFQFEQIVQLIAGCPNAHRRSEQIAVVLGVLERHRFSQRAVLRALIALTVLYSSSPFNVEPNAIELVVVAAGIYADAPAVQVAAIEALMAIASLSPTNAARVENLVPPIVLDQALARNASNAEVQTAVARLLLRLADLAGPNGFDVPQSVPCLMGLLGGSTVSATLLLAALRSCFNNAKKDCLPRVLSEDLANAFVTTLESAVPSDVAVAREASLTVESLMSSVQLRESLIRAGVVAVPLSCLKLHSVEYPGQAKFFLSAIHACVLASARAASQFARLDGVQLLMQFGLGHAEWRALAILADACSVEETKLNSFNPDDDIARILEFLARTGRQGADIELALQAVRLVGEIGFNSSFSTKELFEQLNPLIRPWSSNVSFPLSTVIWALLSRKIKPGFDRITSPSGRELTVELAQGTIREYNVWVTAQGGAQVGAAVTKTKREEQEAKREERGFVDSLSEYFAPEDRKRRSDRNSS